MADAPLRIGILGAARIAPMALVRPARQVPEVAVVAVAARDHGRAQAFAKKHGLARVHVSYDALLADPEIDAIYNPLPNSEKPIASNAAEAERMAGVARQTGRVLVEAFHWRYHPLAARLREIIDAGELGAVRHIETHFCIPLVIPGDIRYRLDLAGGATMDTGCYAISILRFLAGAEPEVVGACAKLSSPGVDRYMAADFRFADGRTGRMTCSLFSTTLFRSSARVRGDRGELKVLNPVVPQFFHRLTVRNDQGARTEHLRGDATYTYQLRAFAAAVRSGTPLPTGPDHGVANMKVIDAVYTKAGLPLRGNEARTED
jgi:predicted dehydrogenase